MAGGGVFGALGRETFFLTSLGLLFLRVAFGGTLILAHGWPKLVTFSEKAGAFPDPLGIGGPASLGLVVGAEVFAAGAVVVGLFTRLACVPVSVTMAVALFAVHGADPWKQQELSFVYLVVFVALAITGPGRFSADRGIFGNQD